MLEKRDLFLLSVSSTKPQESEKASQLEAKEMGTCINSRHSELASFNSEEDNEVDNSEIEKTLKTKSREEEETWLKKKKTRKTSERIIEKHFSYCPQENREEKMKISPIVEEILPGEWMKFFKRLDVIKVQTVTTRRGENQMFIHVANPDGYRKTTKEFSTIRT